MNVLLSLNGETLITETDVEEARLLHSLLEFMTRYRQIHGEKFADTVTDEEIEFAKKLSDELGYYLDYGTGEVF